MATPSIILPQGYLLITQSASYLGLNSIDNKMLFGIIALAYTTSGYLVAGLSVSFEVAKASRLVYGSTIYFLISEEFVTGNEGTPPP